MANINEKNKSLKRVSIEKMKSSIEVLIDQ